jgi:Domain of unknown function (DUF932)
VCTNTHAAIARAKASFAIRHTGGARGAINEARTALGLSWRYIEAFEAEAAGLYAAPMDVEEVRDFAAELVKVDQAPSTAARTRRQTASSNCSCPPRPCSPSRKEEGCRFSPSMTSMVAAELGFCRPSSHDHLRPVCLTERFISYEIRYPTTP